MFSPLSQKSPQNPISVDLNAKPIIHGTLRKSHVNGATNLKLYSYISIGKYLGNGVCQQYSATGVGGGAGPFNANLGPHLISETTGARKLKLKTQ